MNETWKNIPGYGGKYQADREGNIRRVYSSGKTKLMTSFKKKMSGSQRLVVKLTKDGKGKDEILLQLIAKTFIGPCPLGCIPYHVNGCQGDNYVQNIRYIKRSDLGKLTGAKAKRQPVVKINSSGEMIEFYPSAREAAKKNYMSYQTIIDRCNGKCKSAYAPDGFAYAWEDSEVSLKHAIRKIEQHEGYMPKAPDIIFDF